MAKTINPSAAVDLESELISDIGKLSLNPYGFSKYAYPWGVRDLSNSSGAYIWQKALLQDIQAHLKSKSTRYQPYRHAVASGHGIGKSSLVSMIIHWGLSTCEDCKIIVTANTGTQLATKTVPEAHKWFRLGINAHWFDVKATSITVKDEGHERTWRCDFIPWSAENTEAFAGLHNKGKRIILIFDEASAIADKIWEVAEGALTDEETEIIWLAFGNPTQNSGRFKECFGVHKNRWKNTQIDSRNVEGTNKQEISRWVEDYGEDSDFVRVRVRGEFPRAASNQLIASDLVARARKYRAEGYAGLPKVLSVDVARYGDDQTVIGWRQGRRFAIIAKLRGLSTVQVAERTIEQIESAKKLNEPYDAWVIDGDGLGAGVVDHLEHRGYGRPNLFEFHGGETPQDVNAYFNKRAECWGLTRDWLKAGAEIPDDPELEADLTGPQYGFSSKQQIQLEKKEDMKKRGLASPDCFIAGTMVRTPNGERRIEELKAGDYVTTPFGSSRIAFKHITTAESLTAVCFSNGARLTGKGKHEIFSWNAGKIRLDSLTLTDEVETFSLWRLTLWRLASLSFIGARNFGFRQAVDTIKAVGTKRRRDFFIVGFGKTLLGISRRVSIFITKMGMEGTIKFPTWRFCLPMNIKDGTCVSDFQIQKPARKTKSILPLPELRLQNGTVLKQAERGTGSTQKPSGKDVSLSNQPVRDAVQAFRLTLKAEQNSAPITASNQPPISGTRRMKEFVVSAAKSLWRIAITRFAIVPISVQTEIVPPTLTYNLTLREHNAYYANGILVFNCADCLAMSFSVRIAARKTQHKTEYQYVGGEGLGWMT